MSGCVNNLDELAKTLHGALSVETVDIEHVKKLMEGYSSNPVDWQRFTSWDKHKYVSRTAFYLHFYRLSCRTRV